MTRVGTVTLFEKNDLADLEPEQGAVPALNVQVLFLVVPKILPVAGKYTMMYSIEYNH